MNFISLTRACSFWVSLVVFLKEFVLSMLLSLLA